MVQSRQKDTLEQSTLLDILEAIIQGFKSGYSKREIMGQIELILDPDAQKAIEDGFREYREGKTRKFDDAEQAIRWLHSSEEE